MFIEIIGERAGLYLGEEIAQEVQRDRDRVNQMLKDTNPASMVLLSNLSPP